MGFADRKARFCVLVIGRRRSGQRLVGPWGKLTLLDVPADCVHEFLVEPEIVKRQQDRAEHLAAIKEMADGAAGIPAAGVTVAAGVEYKPLQNFGLRAELAHYGVAGWALDLPTAGSTSNQFQSYVARVGVTWYFH